MFAVLALSMSFAACGSDDDDVSTPYSSNPAQSAAGTYTGTWTRTQVGETTQETAEGTLTIEATDTYAGKVTFTAAGFSLAASSVTNISFDSDGYSFYNQLATNGIGAKFAGKISQGKTATVGFTLSQRVGRKLYEYKYEFIGNK